MLVPRKTKEEWLTDFHDRVRAQNQSFGAVVEAESVLAVSEDRPEEPSENLTMEAVREMYQAAQQVLVAGDESLNQAADWFADHPGEDDEGRLEALGITITMLAHWQALLTRWEALMRRLEEPG